MSEARGASVARRLRSAGGRLIRRAGFLPVGMPDGVGQDEQLLGGTLPHALMVFFPNPPSALHQLRPWYSALAELNRHHRLVVVLEDSRTAREVRQDSSLDAIVVASYTTMDDLLSRSQVKVALYVDDHEENFSNLRFTSLVHARLLRSAGQRPTARHLIKAYDFALVPGETAVDRIAASSTFYDARARCLPVGVPWSGQAADVQRFLAAIDHLIELRDREHARLTGPRALRG